MTSSMRGGVGPYRELNSTERAQLDAGESAIKHLTSWYGRIFLYCAGKSALDNAVSALASANLLYRLDSKVLNEVKLTSPGNAGLLETALEQNRLAGIDFLRKNEEVLKKRIEIINMPWLFKFWRMTSSRREAMDAVEVLDRDGKLAEVDQQLLENMKSIGDLGNSMFYQATSNIEKAINFKNDLAKNEQLRNLWSHRYTPDYVKKSNDSVDLKLKLLAMDPALIKIKGVGEYLSNNDLNAITVDQVKDDFLNPLMDLPNLHGATSYSSDIAKFRKNFAEKVISAVEVAGQVQFKVNLKAKIGKLTKGGNDVVAAKVDRLQELMKIID